MTHARISLFLMFDARICMFFFNLAFILKSRKIALWSKTVLVSALSIVQLATYFIRFLDIQKNQDGTYFNAVEPMLIGKKLINCFYN